MSWRSAVDRGLTQQNLFSQFWTAAVRDPGVGGAALTRGALGRALLPLPAFGAPAAPSLVPGQTALVSGGSSSVSPPLLACLEKGHCSLGVGPSLIQGVFLSRSLPQLHLTLFQIRSDGAVLGVRTGICL